MVEPVADLLNGRGHVVIRARDVGLSDVEDAIVIDYSLVDDLVIVTFDPHIPQAIRRRGQGRCLHIRTREIDARERLRLYYDEVVAHFTARARRVVLPANAPPVRLDG
jgi:predicted nuclease of predicted toxin-antitoxin system